jgi:peptidoglycan/LPS O-acetylase OafA/YrhL
MRYNALESWRGVCACLVILYHFDPYSHIHDAAFFRHAYLFVDFFFVLSGFIIFETYFDRLAQGFRFEKFVAMRLGRLYPMHVLTLALTMVYLILRTAMAPVDGSMPPLALAGLFDNTSTITQITFLNAMGLRGDLSWNLPSWSIGAEFYTYLVFGLAIVWVTGSVNRFTGLVALMALSVLMLTGRDTINLTYDFGFVRCLYGFALGALLSRVRPANGYFKLRPRWQATMVELAAIAVVAVFVWGAGSNRLSFLAPGIFVIVVAVFADEHGLIGQWMRHRHLVWVGERSYSIYMMQFLSIVITMDVLWLIDTHAGTGLRAMLGIGGAGTVWFGDLATALMVAIVIGASALTYRYVEQPCRAWMRSATATMPTPLSTAAGRPADPPLNRPVSK